MRYLDETGDILYVKEIDETHVLITWGRRGESVACTKDRLNHILRYWKCVPLSFKAYTNQL